MRVYCKTLLLIVGCVLFGMDRVQAKPLKLALDWKPEAEFGGFYAAQEQGYFEKLGLNVEIQPGGSGTPTVQMLASGQVDFAITGSTDILISQERGADAVAIFAVYQTYPHAIMVHPERQFNSLADVLNSEGKLAVQAGLPYVLFLKKQYPQFKVQFVPYPGGISQFIYDKDYSQQCYVTSEPIAAEKKGVKAQTFLLADAGFNPYVTVLTVRRKLIVEQPDMVEKFVRATRMGWESYLKDSTKVNVVMNKLNPSMDLETLEKSANIQKELIQNAETETHGLGYMSEQRWQDIQAQMRDLGLVKRSVDVKEFFKNY